MKLIGAIVLLFLVNTAYPQDTLRVPVEEGEVVKRKVVHIFNTSANELVNRAKHYAANDSRQSGLITKEAMVSFTTYDDFIAQRKSNKVKMTYKVTVECKENRYRVSFSDIEFTPYPTDKVPQPFTVDANDLYAAYAPNTHKSNRRTNAQRNYFFSMLKIFENREEALKEVMERSVPQEADDW